MKTTCPRALPACSTSFLPLSLHLLGFLPLALTMYMPLKNTNQLLPSHRHRRVTALVNRTPGSRPRTARKKMTADMAATAMSDRFAIALLCRVGVDANEAVCSAIRKYWAKPGSKQARPTSGRPPRATHNQKKGRLATKNTQPEEG